MSPMALMVGWGPARAWLLNTSRTVRVMMGKEAVDPRWVPAVGGAVGVVAGGRS